MTLKKIINKYKRIYEEEIYKHIRKVRLCMTERTFDYEQVNTVLNNIRQITGDMTNPESIAGILYNINNEVHECLEGSDGAVSGYLAHQILESWENTSANFNDFVANFNKWAEIIATSAGKYENLQQDVKNLKISPYFQMPSNTSTCNSPQQAISNPVNSVTNQNTSRTVKTYLNPTEEYYINYNEKR